MLSFDLNCDMGEGFELDAAIMPFISSVNIACGYHAGDEGIMRRTVELALKHGVAIGAHPSYPDREHFGRRDMLEAGRPADDPGRPGERETDLDNRSGKPMLTFAGLPRVITEQLTALKNICDEHAVTLHHVKVHGALYNRAAKDPAVSALCCEAIWRFDPSLLIYGLSGSVMEAEAGRYGLHFVREVFADRRYREDGSLTPRTETGALIEDPALALRQVIRMIKEGRIATTEGLEIELMADTVCIHGDGSRADEFARMIHEGLLREGIAVEAP